MKGPRPFAFALCQAGAEKLLEREVATSHPALRTAFRRPGLLTWKSSEGLLDPGFALDGSVFARTSGLSLGSFASEGALLDAARELAVPLRLHVVPRERYRPGEAPEGDDAPARAAEIERSLRRLAGDGVFFEAPRPALGDTVLDVVVGEPGEPLFAGFHEHREGRSPNPGGRLPLVVPTEAPSRAYAKLVEALDFAGFEVRPGDVAVEIGSAPGGASYALLEHGAHVVGIDPGAMDPAVFRFDEAGEPRFRHLQLPVGAVKREDLPAHVDWLAMDVHLAPPVALRAAQRLVAMFRRDLRGVIFTLKLNDPAWAERLPAWRERVAAMGLSDVRVRQLPANRQEVCVVAKGPAANRPRGRGRGLAGGRPRP